MIETLTVVGASARAAAQSARRAGFAVHAGDLFADVDLRRLCPVVQVGDYPTGLLEVIRRDQPGEWLYTGALENYPELIDEMARARPLLGNSGEVLRRVRDPLLVAAALGRRGLLAPQVTRQEPKAAAHMRWLRKPLQSAGGARVRLATETHDEHRSPADAYFQQFIPGSSCSAVYVAAGGRATLLGVSRQLVGQTWSGAREPFQYCGSIGPLILSATDEEPFARIGNALAEEFQLLGLFGVDAIWNRQGIWPVEVNPRYTASVEVLERARRIAAIGWHVQACRAGQLPAGVPAVEPHSSTPIWGKIIVFATQRLRLPAELEERFLQGDENAKLADLPAADSVIEQGWPILTILTSGASEQQVYQRLRNLAQRVRRQLAPEAI